ncbi:MAG: hypothetical protein MUP63_02680 [Candidatus Nanohaloarchaeota archaeon QJJ-7]|nr:hypothetical protein [Candidatus Nanohaloarchaeota archaeon QJJ-7]
MSDEVMETLENGTPAEVLEAALEDDDYRTVPVEENRYHVLRGSELLIIGIRGEGVYIEEIGDGGLERYDFVNQEPWEWEREKKYSLEGDPAVVGEKIYRRLDDADLFLESVNSEGRELYIDGYPPNVVVGVRGDMIAMRESGDVEVPDLESVSGVTIEDFAVKEKTSNGSSDF